MPANSLFYTDYETLYVNFVILTSYLSLHWGTGSWWRYLFWIFISHGCPMQSSPIGFPWNKYCFCHSVKSSLGIIFSSSFFQSLIDQTGTLNTESPPFIFLSQFSFTTNGSCQTFLVWTNLFARHFGFFIRRWTISHQHLLHLSSVPLSLKYTLNYVIGRDFYISPGHREKENKFSSNWRKTTLSEPKLFILWLLPSDTWKP